MKSMNKDYIEKNDIANRYLQGRLTPEEQEAFENFLMDSPELLEELEMNALFIKTMPQLDTYPSKKRTFSFFSIFENRWLSGGAAGFALGILMTLVFLPAVQSPFHAETTFDVFYAQHSTVRGNAVEPVEGLSHFTFSVTTMPDVAVLVLQEEVAFAHRYAVSVKNIENQEFVFKNRRLTSTSDGELMVALEKNKVAPGKYAVIYAKDNSNDQAQILYLTINK